MDMIYMVERRENGNLFEAFPCGNEIAARNKVSEILTEWEWDGIPIQYMGDWWWVAESESVRICKVQVIQ